LGERRLEHGLDASRRRLRWLAEREDSAGVGLD
jgi:hypothetical protein